MGLHTNTLSMIGRGSFNIAHCLIAANDVRLNLRERIHILSEGQGDILSCFSVVHL